MFDHHDRVARVAQLVQHLEQQLDVGEVQAGGGLVQDVERAPGVAFGEFERELDALGLAAREGGRALAQGDVGQAHVEQGLQLAVQRGHGVEKRVRLLDRHLQNLRDVFALVNHVQGFAVVALAAAHVAGHVHVGQKVHLDLHHAVALAGLAAPTADVEGKTPRTVSALARGRYFGHQFADTGEQAGVGRRVAARRAANRALVDVDDLVEVLNALDGVVHGGLVVGAVERAGHGRVQRVVDQGGLARARDAGHAGQQTHGKGHAHVVQVVTTRTQHANGLPVTQRGLVRGFAGGAAFGRRAHAAVARGKGVVVLGGLAFDHG